MQKWRLLVVLMLVFGLMGSIAAAEEADMPVVVVDLPLIDDMQPLYAEPNENAAVLGEYPRGTYAWLLGEADGFSRIRLGDGTEGYFPSDKLLDMTPFTGLVKPLLARQRQYWLGRNNLRLFRLYEAPLDTAPHTVIRPVHRQPLTVLGQFGGWFHLRTQDGQEGYIPCVELDLSLDLAERPTDESGYYFLFAREDMRVLGKLYAEPSEASTVLGEYYNGTQMEYLDTIILPDGNTAWMKTRIGDVVGYVQIDFVNGVYLLADDLWAVG
ncbi:MAG: SH3 domain-containing protein [Oscillospiraceae bacterium]|nr:SH3 domain-containing protein [Oscillospiraceae bacterium]